MTIATTDNRAQYVGNGVTTAFSYPYPLQAAADLVVVETVIATGVDTIKTLTTDYTVAIASGGGSATVTAVAAPASTVRWTIYRDPDVTQESDIVDNDPLPAATLENAFDKLTMISQRTRELVTRALRQPEGDTADIGRLPSKVSRLGKFLYFNATTGDPEAAAGTTEVPVSAFMETVLDDTDAATARTTLGLAIGTDVQAYRAELTEIDVHGADIASASTIDLDAATGDLVDVTGTTAITAITLAEGVEKTVRFTGALTLTNGASLVLPGAANITTAAGDFAVFRGYASGVVRCVTYTKADGTPVVDGGLDAATQADMETATSNTVAVTPGRTRFHPGVVKMWINFNGTGTPAARASYGFESITDNGTGNYTLGYDPDLASGDVSVAGSWAQGTEVGTSVAANGFYPVEYSTTAVRVLTTSQGSNAVDATYVHVQVWGDQ